MTATTYATSEIEMLRDAISTCKREGATQEHMTALYAALDKRLSGQPQAPQTTEAQLPTGDGTGRAARPARDYSRQIAWFETLLSRKCTAEQADAMRAQVGDSAAKRSTAIDSLTAMRDLPTAAPDRQTTFLRTLVDLKIAPEMRPQYLIMIDGLDRRDRSKLIDTLKAMRDLTPAAAPKRTVVDEGLYIMDGEIFKVQANSKGYNYAAKLDVDTRRYSYAKGAITRLTPQMRMTVEQAAEFGDTYNFCVRCGTELTNDDSITRGIGPVCASKI